MASRLVRTKLVRVSEKPHWKSAAFLHSHIGHSSHRRTPVPVKSLSPLFLEIKRCLSEWPKGPHNTPVSSPRSDRTDVPNPPPNSPIPSPRKDSVLPLPLLRVTRVYPSKKDL